MGRCLKMRNSSTPKLTEGEGPLAKPHYSRSMQLLPIAISLQSKAYTTLVLSPIPPT